jgi:hypothetical protein
MYTHDSFLAHNDWEEDPTCRSFVMGRTGIEPVTLGLKVDVKLLWQFGTPDVAGG